MARSQIEDIIEEIEEYIDTCKPVAFSSTKISVNRDDIQNFLEELKASTPEEIRRYQKIISNEKAILDNAKKQAESILAQAQIKTDELVSEHQIMTQAYSQANEVVMQATKRAQEVLDKATNDANDIRMGAIHYTDDLLKKLQEVMVRVMDSTRMKADAYLTEMQGYLDVVVANRMELSPAPEEIIVDSPQPKTKPVQQAKDQPKKVEQEALNRQATSRLRSQNTQSLAQGTDNSVKDVAPQKANVVAEDQKTNESSEQKTNPQNAASDETSPQKAVQSISDKFFNKD